MKTKYLILIIVVLFFTACDNNNEKIVMYELTDEVKKAPIVYIDFEKFKEGRPCVDLKFVCLPESLDKSWQDVLLKDGLDLYELSPKIIEQYDAYVKEMWRKYELYHSTTHPKGEEEPMFITQLERGFLDKVKAKRFLEEMEQNLEKEFQDFWKDIPKKVRYRWIRRAMNKAEKFGYDPKQNNAIVELCARIGLDFDLDPKWKAITKFIQKKERYIRLSIHYIDYTVFNKTHDKQGNKYTDWYLREAFPSLLKPKRPLPKLNN